MSGGESSTNGFVFRTNAIWRPLPRRVGGLFRTVKAVLATTGGNLLGLLEIAKK